MITAELTQEELLQRGYKALREELGLVDMIRFLQLLRPGKGDYTAERHQWLDGDDVESIYQSILKRRSEKKG